MNLESIPSIASISTYSSIKDKDINKDSIENKQEEEAEEDRKALFISKILSDRKSSALTISSKLSSIYHIKTKLKTSLLTSLIISHRIKAITILNANIKGFYQRKRMENYLSKLHCSYKISTCIDNSTKIKMVVYLNNGLEKEFQFEYDSYSGKYVLFIPRNTVTESTYKFNFISDGKIIIDSSFASISEKEKYMNVINFNQIKKEEEEKIKTERIHLRYIMCLLKKKSNSSNYSNANDANMMFRRSLDFIRKQQGSSGNITNVDDEGCNGNGNGNDDDVEVVDKELEERYSKLAKKMSSSCIKTVFHKSLTVSKDNKDLDFDCDASVCLARPKSILKNLRRDSNNALLNGKKVSFKKKVEYSI